MAEALAELLQSRDAEDPGLQKDVEKLRDFETYVQPNAGHVINLHESAEMVRGGDDWLAHQDARANAAR